MIAPAGCVVQRPDGWRERLRPGESRSRRTRTRPISSGANNSRAPRTARHSAEAGTPRCARCCVCIRSRSVMAATRKASRMRFSASRYVPRRWRTLRRRVMT
jgi:hypothetical protein